MIWDSEMPQETKTTPLAGLMMILAADCLVAWGVYTLIHVLGGRL